MAIHLTQRLSHSCPCDSTIMLIQLVAGAFILANAKSLPGVYCATFYYYVYKHFYQRGHVKPKSVFQEFNYVTYSTLLEMDMNLHKGNSTYFMDMDISRSKAMSELFKDFYKYYKDDTVMLRRGEFTYTPLGSVELVFFEEIRPFDVYNVKSYVLGWTEKWIFLISKFERGGKVLAVGLSKYVFKQRRKTVPPAVALEYAGLLTAEAVAQNEKVRPTLDHALRLETMIV